MSRVALGSERLLYLSWVSMLSLFVCMRNRVCASIRNWIAQGVNAVVVAVVVCLSIQFNSIESEIDIRKLLFLGGLLTEPKMTFVVKSLFQSRAASYFDPNIKSIGVLPSICDTLCKYNFFIYFETWFHNSVFPCYEEWKSIVYTVRNSEMNKWTEYCVSHPNLHVEKSLYR